MSASPIEQHIADDELVVPPLPSWLLPAVIAITVTIGLAIWYLYTASDPVSAMAGPSWLFLCH